MQFAINYKEREILVDVTSWESTIDNRIEFYVVFINQQETFINFVRRTDQLVVTEVASSADLNADIKAIIKEKLICLIQEQPQTTINSNS